MRSDSALTFRGCLNTLVGLFLLFIVCFGVGLGIQVALRQNPTLGLIPPTPTATTLPPAPTAENTPTPRPSATLAPSVTATTTPSPTATTRPTRTPRPTIATPETPESTATATEAAVTEYEVQAGDSMAAIAADFGIPLSALLEANPDVDPAALAIGTILVIPTE